MKAGGVQFADTPDEAAEHAEHVLALEINGHMPRGVMVDTKADIAQEYYAGVVWDGTNKQPVMIFSDVGGIDIEQVAEDQPDRVGRRHFQTTRPFSPFMAKELIASVGVTGSDLNKLIPIVTKLAQLFVDYDMTLAEINPLGKLDGRLVRGARRAHGHGERGPRAPEGAAEGPRRGRRGDAPGARGDGVRARRRGGRRPGPPRRGRQRHRVRRRPRPRHRRRRRVADALRRGPQPRRQARQLLRDRRQPVRAQGGGPGQARAAASPAWTRSP